MNLTKIASWGTCLLVFIFLILTGCKDKNAELVKKQREIDDAEISAYITANNIQNAQRQTSGLYYVPQTVGTGAQVQKGSTVKIHYIGRVLGGGILYKFESTYDSGNPGNFKMGVSQVVPGMEEGLLLMKSGEKATIYIPSYLGYGRYGNYSSIPGNAVLVFEISVLEVK